MSGETTRRNFLHGGALTTAGIVAAGGAAKGEEQEKPDDPQAFPRFARGRGGPVGSPSDRGKLTRGFRGPGLPPVGVTMPDLPKLPWKMVDGAKEFHLVAEVVRREFLPGQFFNLWGYNGTMPGPLIEATQGDRVRIVVHNHLPEPTTLHWHGGEMPVRFDGVEGITQDPIPPGETFAYEYDLHQEGSYFYHSHGAMQEIMGMAGMFVIHPREAFEPAVDHDFALIFQEFAILPQAYIPNSVSMAFNWFTINGRSGPYTTPMVVRHGSRVRVRLMNLSAMDHHPIHFHGHTWWNTGTEAGRIPETAWIPGNTQLIGVAQVRDMEFIANNVGDWIFHCHIPHHMMNHMTSMTGPGRMLSGEDMQRLLGGTGGGGPAAIGLGGGLGMGGIGSNPGMMSASSGTAQQMGTVGQAGHGGGGAGFSGMLASGGFQPIHLPAGTEAGPYEGQLDKGPALNSDLGPALGHGLGPETNSDHATRTGGPLGGMGMDKDRYRDPRWNVPGWPQDMMDMKEKEWNAEEVAKLKGRRETFGMRHNWYIGPNAMMTVLRVLPDELYEKVTRGLPDIPDGASIPDGS